jgi:hypothetical protein
MTDTKLYVEPLISDKKDLFKRGCLTTLQHDERVRDDGPAVVGHLGFYELGLYIDDNDAGGGI